MKIDLYAALKTLNFTLQNGKSISNGIKLLEHNAENKKEKIVYQNLCKKIN